MPEVPAGHGGPFRAGEHRRGVQPVVGAARVGREGRHGVAAVGLAGGGDLVAVQQAGEQATRLPAQCQQPAEHEGHVRGLVDEVWLVRRGPGPAVRAREVHDRDHVACARPGVQQPRIRAAALHEPGREHQQRERAAGRRPPGGRPRQRIADLGHQQARAEALAGRAGVGRLGERYLRLADAVTAGGAEAAGPPGARAGGRAGMSRLAGVLAAGRGGGPVQAGISTRAARAAAISWPAAGLRFLAAEATAAFSPASRGSATGSGEVRGRGAVHHGRVPLFSFEGLAPTVSPQAWIAPTATLVGDVRVEAEASVWYGAVLRADFGPIVIRRGANVQDGSVLHGGRDPVTEVGEGATIGHVCVVHGAVVHAEALIGNGATV